MRHSLPGPYPPLYALLLGGWIRLLGDTEVVLRAFSVVAGLAALLAGWRWAHEALGRWPGLLAMGLLAVSPLAVANARDARMYSLETAFATICWWLTWRLASGRASGSRGVGRPVVSAVGLALASAGELWTLSLGLPTAFLQFVVAAAAGLGATRLGGVRAGLIRRGALQAAGAIVAGGLLFLPWLPAALRSAVAGEPFWTPPPGSFDWAETWLTAVLGWRTDLPAWDLARGVIVLSALLGVGALARTPRPDARILALAIAAGMALTIIIWAVSTVRSIYDTRYLGASLPPVVLAVTAGIRAIGRLPVRRASVVPRAAALGLAVTLLGLSTLGTIRWLDDWRAQTGLAPATELATEIRGRARPNDLLLTIDPRSYFPMAYALERVGQADGGQDLLLKTWDRGDEPFYRGLTLIDEDHVVRRLDVLQSGWRGALPELRPGGRIWLVAAANAAREDLGFRPLEDAELVEIDRIVVRRGTDAAQARLVELARDP